MKYAFMFALLAFGIYPLGICSASTQPAVYIQAQEILPLTHFWNGRELARRLNDPSVSTEESHSGLGYVMGVADAISGVSACYPIGALQLGMYPAISKFFSKHPDRLNEPASTLVREALTEAYPCNKPSPLS